MAHNQKRFQRSGSRANRGWAGFTFDNITIGPGPSKTLFGFLSPVPGFDETLLRSMGTIMAVPTTGGDDLIIGALGMIVVNDIAISQGVAAIPGPITDINSDGWLMYQTCFAARSSAEDMGFVWEFDSKAKRVVEDGQSVAIIWESVARSDQAVVDLNIRTLTMIRGTG